MGTYKTGITSAGIFSSARKIKPFIIYQLEWFCTHKNCVHLQNHQLGGIWHYYQKSIINIMLLILLHWWFHCTQKKASALTNSEQTYKDTNSVYISPASPPWAGCDTMSVFKPNQGNQSMKRKIQKELHCIDISCISYSHLGVRNGNLLTTYESSQKSMYLPNPSDTGCDTKSIFK